MSWEHGPGWMLGRFLHVSSLANQAVWLSVLEAPWGKEFEGT